MDQGTGIFIAVPEDIAAKVLFEGYQCSRRRRVPAHHNREGALRGYHRSQRQLSRPPLLLQVVSLPSGVAASPYKDGVKLETRHLPAQHLKPVNRSHSASAFSPMPCYQYQPPLRSCSFRPSAPGPQLPGTRASDRQLRLQRQDNVRTLYHCTSESNAINICRQKAFRAGTNGFLGPGIYFSQTPSNARRYCQCRTGTGPRVILECRVNLGNAKRVPKGHYTGQQLLADGCDSYEEVGRDCFMLPDNQNGQINMDEVFLNRSL